MNALLAGYSPTVPSLLEITYLLDHLAFEKSPVSHYSQSPNVIVPHLVQLFEAILEHPAFEKTSARGKTIDELAKEKAASASLLSSGGGMSS